MSVRSQVQSQPDNELLFVDCEKDDLLFGEKLQSIVGYAMSRMGIGEAEAVNTEQHFISHHSEPSFLESVANAVRFGATASASAAASTFRAMSSMLPTADKKQDPNFAAKNFHRYCEGLGKKLGPYEPYYRSVSLSATTKHKIAKTMHQLLPKDIKEFRIVLAQAAEQLEQRLDMPITEVSKLFYNSASKELNLSQLVVMKVFRAGENLEITPCLFKVKLNQEQGSFLSAVTWDSCKVEMLYEERKYVMTKFMILQIIKKLKAEAEAAFG